MARCVSWVPLEGSGHGSDDGPGGVLRRWVPCRNRVSARGQRCSRCVRELLAHPDAQVRMWLAAEPGQDVGVLEVLAGDLNPQVAGAARRALSARGTDGA